MTDRLWFKIGEASRRVGATPKELRYWEKLIPELRPRRSKGNLRYYHADELPRLRQIRDWLAEGLTVADCRERLAGEAPAPVREAPPAAPRGGLGEVVTALRSLLLRLGGTPGPPPPASPARASRTRRPRSVHAPALAAPEVAPMEGEGATSQVTPEGPPAEALIEPRLLDGPPTDPGAPAEEAPPSSEPPKPRRAPRARSTPAPEPLGRMWSDGRLPMDWDD